MLYYMLQYYNFFNSFYIIFLFYNLNTMFLIYTVVYYIRIFLLNILGLSGCNRIYIKIININKL
jgi:hypothetical protein